MAVYIEIRKVSEDSDTATFTFAPADGPQGIMTLRKASGEVELISAIPGDSPQRGIFARAAQKIRSHWKRGEVPELTSWAS